MWPVDNPVIPADSWYLAAYLAAPVTLIFNHELLFVVEVREITTHESVNVGIR